MEFKLGVSSENRDSKDDFIGEKLMYCEFRGLLNHIVIY